MIVMSPDRTPDISRLLRRLPHGLHRELENAPLSGDGVHRWIFIAALKLNRCRSLSDDERDTLLRWAVRDCGRKVPQREIDDAVRNSKHLVQSPPKRKSSDHQTHSKGPRTRRSGGWPDENSKLRAKVLSDSPFSLAELRKQAPAATGEPHQDSDWYVDQLFPGDPLVCVGASPAVCRTMPLSGFKRRFTLGAHPLIVPSPMSALSGTSQEGKRSVRCLDNTGRRRFLVTEFDSGTLDEHASLIWHLRAYAPLVMVLWSGSKSLHAWWDAHNVPEDTLRRFFSYAVSLGADRSTWPRCQFVRLPEGWREEKRARQSVYYFDPCNLPLADHELKEVSS